MTTLSVIVPVYNSRDWLDECVRSILGQTWSDLEVILVDDGSTDGSAALCDGWAIRDRRVRVLHQENRGVSAARNAGLDAARGTYLALADSDDWLEPQMYAAMLEPGCDVVLCDCIKEHPGGPELYTHPIRSGFYDRAELEREYFPQLLMREQVAYPATISNWTMLFRRELVRDIRYLTGVRHSEDLLFGAQLLYRAHSFCYLKGRAFYHYRIHAASASHRFHPDKWSDYKILHGGIRDFFGRCPEQDFTRQIDLCLLFFLYNTVGDLYGAPLQRREKRAAIQAVLEDPEVRAMFRRLELRSLPICRKQKLLTWLYRHRIGLCALIRHYGG